MQDDGTAPVPITAPPDAGIWGKANLPFGDYDPRLSPDGRKIVFERLEDDTSPHGNYNIFVVNADGSDETRLTDSGYSQGTANWSHSQTRLVFVVAAIGSEGKYDIYMMNADGSNITMINPDHFPPDLLCHSPVFSVDDSKIFFVGQWWE
jgi:Tol biopolymer transport system component